MHVATIYGRQIPNHGSNSSGLILLIIFKYLLHALVWNNFEIILLLLCLLKLYTQMELSNVLLTCIFLSKCMLLQRDQNFIPWHIKSLKHELAFLPWPAWWGACPISSRARPSRSTSPRERHGWGNGPISSRARQWRGTTTRNKEWISVSFSLPLHSRTPTSRCSSYYLSLFLFLFPFFD